jgi:hypothetical protein
VRARDWCERFWEKVRGGAVDDCWPWTGAISKNGYGSLKIDGKAHTASRLAYELDRGPPPSNCMVLHTCDNRACCNPNHLYLGDVKQNSRDMMERGRHRTGPTQGSLNGNAKLTEADIIAIRSKIASGLNNKQIAAQFRVTHQMVSKIRLGHFWAHVPQAGAQVGAKQNLE